MANRIVLKRTATAGLAPAAGELVVGELALNTADGALYTRSTGGVVLTLVPPGGAAAAAHTHAASAVVSGELALARGGTGLGTAPGALQLLVGQVGGVYALRTLAAGTGMTITDTGAALLLASTGGGGGGETPVGGIDRASSAVPLTGGQTLVVVPEYTAGYLDVYLNGVRLVDGVDYALTSSTSVTLSDPAVAGDLLEAVSYSQAGGVVRAVTSSTATAGQTAIVVPNYTAGYVDVHLNGVRLVETLDYSAPGGVTVTLTAPAALGDRLDVVAYDPTSEVTRAVTSATGFDGQTVITVGEAYAAGFADVYLNGIRLVANVDFTASGGTTVVLAAPTLLGDLLDVVVYSGAASTTVAVFRGGTATTLVAGAHTQRVLDATVLAAPGMASLAGSQVTLVPGTYLVWAVGTVQADGGNEGVVRYATRVRDVTNSVDLAVSTGGRLAVPAGTTPAAQDALVGAFTLAAGATIELQTYVTDDLSSTNPTYYGGTNLTLAAHTTLTLMKVG
jgi:hypothetical protein